MAAVPVQLGVGRAVSRERSLQGIRFPHPPHGWDGGEAPEQKVEVEARPAGEVFARGLPQERNGLQLLRRENDAAPDRSPNDLPVRTYRAMLSRGRVVRPEQHVPSCPRLRLAQVHEHAPQRTLDERRKFNCVDGVGCDVNAHRYGSPYDLGFGGANSSTCPASISFRRSCG
jgi:hypothetical protein